MRGLVVVGGVALLAGCRGTPGAADSSSAPERDAARPEGPPPPDSRPPPDKPPFRSGVFEHKVPGRTLRLTLLDGNIVRAHYLPDAGAQPERGWTSAITSWPENRLPFVDEGDSFVLRTASLVLEIRKADATLVVRDVAGAVVSEDLPAPAGSYTRRLRKVLPSDAHIYGLGEKTGPLDKCGRRLEMWNTDPWPDYTPSTDPIYQSVPFLIALRQGTAHGLYLASTFKTVFDLGKSVPGELLLESEGGDLDYYFLYGPTVSRVVEAFTEVTGRPALPPLWALGYHQSRWSYSPESELRKVASELRGRGIGCDGLWLDIDYMDGYRSFTWDKTRFPAPKQLADDLAKDGFKLTVIIDPGIKHEPGGGYAVFNDGVAGKHFVALPDGKLAIGSAWPGEVVFPDFSRPTTRAWWRGLVKGLVDAGARGVWIDMNEPTSTAIPLPLDARFDGEGSPAQHREVHNVYALLMARATSEGLAAAAPARRPFVLTRAGFAGVQRHAAVWTGDSQSSWEHLAMAPAMLMNMGLSGVAFAGTDVGGYSGGPSPELYARWLQLGALSPFFRTHSQTGSPRQEPWSFGAEVESISRSTIELRYRWLPYLYSLMRVASLRGHPPLRPLLFEFPSDAKTYEIGDELMLGPFVLAAPVLEAGVASRRVYLPAGLWFDYWSASVFGGGQTVSVAAPLARLPLFLRAGAILPSAPAQRWVGEKSLDTVTLDLYPALGTAASELTLYQDDGSSMAYQSGAYQEVRFELSTAASGATLVAGKAGGSYSSPESKLELRFHGVVATQAAITLDGKPLPIRASAAEVESSGGWYHDGAGRVALARVPFPRSGAKIVCAYDATRPLVRSVQVKLSVSLPAGSTGTVYFASNLDGWSPSGRPLTTSGGVASLVLALDQGSALEYKYTRGAWASVEKGSGCADIANRKLEVKDAGGGQQAVNDAVVMWADACR